MMITNPRQTNPGEVLIAYEPIASRSRWVQDVDDGLRVDGFILRRAHTTGEAVSVIERGSPRAAIVTADRQRIDGLSLLRIIRSLNAWLPCWLVTESADRRTLEIALAMHVVSVLNQPVNGAELALALRRVLLKPQQGA